MADSTTSGVYFQCGVCMSPTRFHHLDAKICSACASFFRRTVREGLKYKCDSNGKCFNGKGRSACRACRFEKCVELGARLQVTADNKNSPPASITAPLLDKDTIMRTPILDDLIRGYDEFLVAQRSMISISYPELRISADNVITLRKVEGLKLKKKSVPIMLDMFNRYFGPFKKLPKKEKLKIVAEVSPEFDMLNSIYLTSRVFPDLSENKVMTGNGCYMDFSRKYADWYYEGYIPSDQIDAYLNLSAPMLNRMHRQLFKFKSMQMRKVDMLAMIMLGLCKCAEKVNNLTPELAAHREALIAEWMANLRRQYGEKEAPQRFTKLMHFYYEIDSLVIEMANMVIIHQINLDRDALVCSATDYITKLDIGDDKD